MRKNSSKLSRLKVDFIPIVPALLTYVKLF